MKKILTTPIPQADIDALSVGDIVYLNGTLITCRDVGHRRIVDLGVPQPLDFGGNAIFHAGPIIRTDGDEYHMVSIGPTTSMRMEKHEREFIRQTGVRMVIGKGGMGDDTAAACREYHAVHALFPGGCAVLAATQVLRIKSVEFADAGMPEALWEMEVKEFGPLIITIDAHGNNMFAEKRTQYRERADEALELLCPKVQYIK